MGQLVGTPVPLRFRGEYSGGVVCLLRLPSHPLVSLPNPKNPYPYPYPYPYP